MSKSTAMRLALPTVVLGLLLAGCSQSTSGDPQPGSSITTKATAASKTSGGNDDPVAKLNSCELMNAAGSLGLTEIKEVGSRSCQAKYPGRVTVRIDLHPGKRIEDFVLGPYSDPPSDTTFGGHKARLIKKPASSSSCSVTVGVADKSRVDFTSSSNADLNQACDAAMALAKAVEPKLP